MSVIQQGQPHRWKARLGCSIASRAVRPRREGPCQQRFRASPNGVGNNYGRGWGSRSVQPRIQIRAGTAVQCRSWLRTSPTAARDHHGLGPVHPRPSIPSPGQKGRAGCGPKLPSLGRPRSRPRFWHSASALRRQVVSASLSRSPSH